MGYSDIRSRKQHEVDAARIAELEAQLKREREERRDEKAVVAPPVQQPPPTNQTIVVRNEGCLAGAGKGCLSVIIGILIFAAIGQLIKMFGG